MCEGNSNGCTRGSPHMATAYSDSINDRSLLRAVTLPAVVSLDERQLAEAWARGRPRHDLHG